MTIVVGDLDRRVVDRGVDRGDPEVFLGAAVQRAADFLADVGAELLQRVELGGVGGEVVVELGEDFLPHLLHLHFEDGVFAGQFRFLVLVGEGDLDVDLVARGGADQLVLEVVDQLARAERQQVVVGLAALEGLAVDEALEVDQHRVALLGGALDRLEAREALADPVDLGVDDLLVDLFLLAADLEPLVLAELGRPGAPPTSNLKVSGSPSASGVATISMSGSPIGVTAASSSAASYHSGSASRIASASTAAEAEALDHQRRRRFAFAEAGQAEFARHRAGGAVGGALDVLRRHLRLDFDA